MRLLSIVLAMFLIGLALAGKNVEQTKPEIVEVQHILIGFKSTLAERPGHHEGYDPVPSGSVAHWRPAVKERIQRNKEEARKLAVELTSRIEAGEEFGALEMEYSDDDHPGRYTVLNSYPRTQASGKTYLADDGNFDRESLPMRVGDAIFSLDVGEVRMVKYSSTHSPFGFHIIKRLR